MARDVKEHAKDLDGLAKNISKLQTETAKIIAAAKEALKGDSHDRGMDAVTEGIRASPYAASHWLVIAIVLAVLIGAAIWYF